MARQARFISPGRAHLVQLQAATGVQPLAAALQRDRLLAWMAEGLDTTAVQLHAYAILPQTVWLLLTPDAAPDLSRFVQGLARRTSRAQERAHPDGGSTLSAPRAPVWAGRFRSAVVQAGEWELAAMVWIDRAAERAGAVADGAVWPWSSRAAHCGEAVVGTSAPALTFPSVYWDLGNTPFAREAAYCERLHQGLSAATVHALQNSLRSGAAVGERVFLQQLEADSGRRVFPAKRGRPRMNVA